MASCNTGPSSSSEFAFSIWRAHPSIFPWYALLDSDMIDSRSTKVANNCCICACATLARLRASLCLKITSFNRDSMSSSRRKLSGGEAALMSASICPRSQRSSTHSSPMFWKTSFKSCSNDDLTPDWSSAAHDTRREKLARCERTVDKSLPEWRSVRTAPLACSRNRSSSSPKAGIALSITRAICSNTVESSA